MNLNNQQNCTCTTEGVCNNCLKSNYIGGADPYKIYECPDTPVTSYIYSPFNSKDNNLELLELAIKTVMSLKRHVSSTEYTENIEHVYIKLKELNSFEYNQKLEIALREKNK